jgi:hypothetical protein
MLVEDYLDTVMPRLPGAEETLVRQEILAALRQFCREGLAWDYRYGPVDITASTTTLTLDQQPADTEIVVLLRTEIMPDGSDSYRSFPAMLALPAKPNETATAPKRYFPETPASLTLYPIPTVTHTNGFRAVVALSPTATTAVLPDVFNSLWLDAIKDGVLSRMHAMASKPWTDASLAIVHGRSFRNQIAQARVMTKNRYGVGNTAWKFPFFAAQET